MPHAQHYDEQDQNSSGNAGRHTDVGLKSLLQGAPAIPRREGGRGSGARHRGQAGLRRAPLGRSLGEGEDVLQDREIAQLAVA